ncbi:MAG: hypothetical protein M3Q57_04105 [Pseudomonadota bacterium]|nr:hypothetical protein [Pseudomonadota bacterium]
MSRSLRFIGFALIGWIGLRALSLGLIPGAEAFAIDRASGLDQRAAKDARALPPVIATEFAPIDPVTPPPQPPPADEPRFAGALSPYGHAPYYYPATRSNATSYVPARPAAPRLALADAGGWSLDEAAAERYAEALPLEQWPLAQIASGSRAPRPSPGQSAPIVPARLDRLSMSAWAMLRHEPGGASSLASNGILGGSQAGARLLWRFDPRLAASFRTSAPIGGVSRGGEIAAGVRWQPVARIPVAVTAERRHAFGEGVGRSAFALFAEGGVYDRPIVAGFDVDAYLQGGVVGVRDRDLFVDGSASLTRPLWRDFSGGFGVWGGAQPGLYRIDAGPRLSWRVGGKIRVHLDYRQRLAGTAAPGSGPVVTIAGDF